MKLIIEIKIQAKGLIRLLFFPLCFFFFFLSSRLEIPGIEWNTKAGMNLIKRSHFKYQSHFDPVLMRKTDVAAGAPLLAVLLLPRKCDRSTFHCTQAAAVTAGGAACLGNQGTSCRKVSHMITLMWQCGRALSSTADLQEEKSVRVLESGTEKT